MPQNTRLRSRRGVTDDIVQVVNLLRIYMNFGAELLGKSLELFGNAAFGAVAAIDKWRKNRDPQVSDSKRAGCAPREQLRRIEKKA